VKSAWQILQRTTDAEWLFADLQVDSLQQCEQLNVDQLAILEEVLPKHSLLYEATFFKDTSRRWILGEDVSRDLHKSKLAKGMLTGTLNHTRHDATAPIRLRQPIPDLRLVRLPHLKTVEAATTNQGIVGSANGELNRLPLLLGGGSENGQPIVGIGFGVGEGNAKGEVVDVSVVEMLDQGGLVRASELGQMDLAIHVDFHDRTSSYVRHLPLD
jgi:hypothetical protein